MDSPLYRNSEVRLGPRAHAQHTIRSWDTRRWPITISITPSRSLSSFRPVGFIVPILRQARLSRLVGRQQFAVSMASHSMRLQGEGDIKPGIAGSVYGS